MFKVLIGVVTATIFAVYYISPILKPFPTPTGSYAIGTNRMWIVDDTRRDPYGNGNEQRLIRVRFWYPAEKGTGTPYSYLGDMRSYFAYIFAQKYNIPRFLSNIFWPNIPTHAHTDATLSSAQQHYPVVIFCHGLLGLPTEMYISFIENIVSYGYIVVALDMPYFNIMTDMPDGSVEDCFALSEQFERMSSQERQAFFIPAIETYKTDIRVVLGLLMKCNEDTSAGNILYGRLDCNKIAVMGHSAGGTAAIEVCRADKRCKAAIDLDGWYDHIIGMQPLEKPLLLIFGSKSVEISEPSSDYLKRKEITREQYYEREKRIAEHRKVLCTPPNSSMIVIPGANHADFCDAILIKWPLRSWNEVDAYKTLTTVNSAVVTFLEQYLK